MATKKTTGTGKKTTTSKSATSTSARAAPPKRAKLTERPKLKVGSRPVSAVPRQVKRVARPPEDDVSPPLPPPPAPRSGSIPPPKGAVPARARTGKPVKKAPSKDDSGRRTALAIAEAALDKKALNVEIIDVRGKVDYCDYVVVMSGRSDRQVSALARSIEEELKKEKIRCTGVEGLGQGAWVLMDFNDVIVHIFHEDMRGYYDLESLWNDASRVEVAQ